jgi:dipeptidyl aminopeptidase/acylaminoacyl peptidase
MFAKRPWITAVFAIVWAGACATGPAHRPSREEEPTPEPVAERPVPGPPRPVAPATGVADAALPSRKLLFAEPDRHTVKISPDGKYLAWLDGKSGAVTLWLAPVADPRKARQVAGDKARPVFDYHFAYTNQHLFYLQDDLGDKNYHLYTMELDTGRAVDVTGYVNTQTRFLASTPKWPTTVVVAMNDRDEKHFDVYQLDLITGERALLGKNDMNLVDFKVDHDLRLRYGQLTMPDGSIEVYMPSKGHQTWGKVDSIPTGDVFGTRFLGFDKGSQKQYLLDGRGRATVGVVELDTQTRAKRVIAEDAKADVVELLVHPVEQTVQAVALASGRTRWSVLDKSVEADLAALDKLDAGDFSVVSRSLDDKLWVVAFRSDRRPPRYHLWNRVTKTATLLFGAQDQLDQREGAAMKPVAFAARDGLELTGYLTAPGGAPAPLVVLVHDGPWSRDSFGYSAMHQFLASRGYAVLSVNFRGSTGLGKKLLDAGNGEWGKKMQTDLADAVEWATKTGAAVPGKVCIVGAGYGGYAALAGLSLTPEAYTCGVSLAGPTRLTTLGEIVWRGSSAASAIYKLRMGDHTTFDGKKALEAVSPLTHAGRISRPLLIVSGGKDERSPLAENEYLVKTLQAKGVPVTFAVMDDEAGVPARMENRLAFYAVLEAFLSAHLGGKYLPLDAEPTPGTSLVIKAGAEGIPGVNGQK